MATPLQNTLSTWHAIFLREMLQRLFAVRMGWMWLIVEPAIHISVIAFILSVIRQREMGGMDVIAWIIIGLLSFFFFRRTNMQVMHAIDCNRAFFAFRQVRPFDVSFMRACVELYVMIIIFILLLSLVAFVGRDVYPHNALLIIAAVLGLWLVGLGFGLVCSVIIRLIPESSHVLMLLNRPLYFTSGVIFPIDRIPPQYREYLLYNPLIHGIESARLGFFPYYNTIPVDLGYLYVWALGLVLLGLVLYRVYAVRLVAL